MSDSEKRPDQSNGRIYVDDSVPAILRYSRKSVSCLTLQEAVIEWHKLPDEIKRDATIKTEDDLYRGWEIDRFWRR